MEEEDVEVAAVVEVAVEDVEVEVLVVAEDAVEEVEVAAVVEVAVEGRWQQRDSDKIL